MSSPLAKRQQLLEQQRLEQEVLSNINKQDQELREQRGFSRSPGQEDRVDEDEYNDRHNKHKENVKNLVNLYDSLESEISGIIDDFITTHPENIDNLSDIFKDTTITPELKSDILNAARNNTFVFMFRIITLLPNDYRTNYDSISSLTSLIFLFSLMDVVFGYKNPNYNTSIIQSKVQNRINALNEEHHLGIDPQTIEMLVKKNIKDGVSIKNKGIKVLMFNLGGKTKRKRRNSKKTQSRKPKKKNNKL
jgi:hypothetical protein